MYNWSVDERELKKDKKKYDIWKLEQVVNFGLGGEKIDAKLLKKYWSSIFIDPSRRKFLSLLLNETRHSHTAPARRARGSHKRGLTMVRKTMYSEDMRTGHKEKLGKAELKGFGYASESEFVKDAVRRRLLELKKAEFATGAAAIRKAMRQRKLTEGGLVKDFERFSRR